MATRTVVGLLKTPDGAAWEGATIQFRLMPGSFTATDQYPPAIVTTVTGIGGAISVDLWTNEDGDQASAYRCTLPAAPTPEGGTIPGETFDFTLPAGATDIELSVVRLAGVTVSDPQYATLVTWILASWKGAWDIATAYDLGDRVSWQGSSYIANVATTAGDEPGVAAAWDLIASGLDLTADATVTGLYSFANAGGLLTDIVGEHTTDAGVTVDGVLIKDGAIAASVVGLGSVENTALSTWTGSANIATVAAGAVTAHQAALSIGAAQVTAGTFPVGAFAFQGAVSGVTTLTATTGAFSGATVGGVALYGDSVNSQFVVGSTFNTIEATVTTAYIMGGGRTGYGNHIGSQTKPVGTGYSGGVPPTDWSDDTGYVAGEARVTSIVGGYDNVVNQLNGAIWGGSHNFIKYNAAGHSFIAGGVYNVISGSLSGIFGASNSTITGGSASSFIFGGTNNNVVSCSYSTIVGGLSNTVSGGYSFAFGRRVVATAAGTFTITDAQDADATNSVAQSFLSRFSGGYAFQGGAAVFSSTVAAAGFNGPIGATTPAAGAFTTATASGNITSSAGHVIVAAGYLQSTRTTAASQAFRGLVSGDTSVRFYFAADGTMNWGTGSAATDTNLYRSAANTLKTDDALIVTGALTTNGGLQTFGANDSAGAGFRLVRVPNV